MRGKCFVRIKVRLVSRCPSPDHKRKLCAIIRAFFIYTRRFVVGKVKMKVTVTVTISNGWDFSTILSFQLQRLMIMQQAIPGKSNMKRKKKGSGYCVL